MIFMKVFERLPNNVVIYVEKHWGGNEDYSVLKNGEKIGFYHIEFYPPIPDNQCFGEFEGNRFFVFQEWLKAIREGSK